MRILIFSDTHGSIHECISVIERIQKADMLLHAGDCVSDAEDLAAVYPHIPIYYVKGNNDFFTNTPGSLVIPAGDKRIFLTHGHMESVKYDREYETLIRKAKERDADLAVFGHTHQPYEGYSGALTLLNPGSIRYGGTYGVCEIDGGKLRTSICSIG